MVKGVQQGPVLVGNFSSGGDGFWGPFGRFPPRFGGWSAG